MYKRYKYFPGKAESPPVSENISTVQNIEISVSRPSFSEEKKLNISLSLEKDSEVKLSLWNMLGKMEYILKNSYQEGLNTINMGVGQLRKGTYLLELISNGERTLRKIVIK
jgi:hypothetical protein